MNSAQCRSQTSAMVLRWLPLLIWMAVIFLVSQQPKSALTDFGSWDLLVKKSGHMFAYGMLALLAVRVRPSYVWVFLFALLYAVSDELHQGAIPSRNGTVVDVVIDLTGVTLALLGLALWRKYQTARSAQKEYLGGP